MKNHNIDEVEDAKRCIAHEKNIHKRLILEPKIVSSGKKPKSFLLNS